MKSLTSLLFIFLINFQLFGQVPNKAFERVDSRIASGKEFKTIELTEPNRNKNQSEKLGELKNLGIEHSILNLKVTEMEKILAEGPEQFTWLLQTENDEVLELSLVKVNILTKDF